MTQADFAQALRGAERECRRQMRRCADSYPAGGCLNAFHLAQMDAADLPKESKTRLAAWLGVSGGLQGLLQDAYEKAGRRVRQAVFALHGVLGVGGEARDVAAGGAAFLDSRPPFPPAYLRLLGLAAGHDLRFRDICARAIETHVERLTMHRYRGPEHRRRHARVLFAEPYAWALGLPIGAAPMLFEYAEARMAYDDVVHAEAQAAHGWNLIEWPRENPLGGFFALADEARPPGVADCRKAAGELRVRVRGVAGALRHGAGLSASVAAWLAGELERIDAALGEYAEQGIWPRWILFPPVHGLSAILRRLRERCFRVEP